MLQATASTKPRPTADTKKVRLLEIIQRKSLLKGHFKLASGATSDYYLDMKPTAFDPEGISLIGDIIYGMLKDETGIDSIGGLELGALPLITAVCARSWPERPVNGFIVRKEKKDHGTAKKIDGNFKDNTSVVLFEDVTTKGGSVMQAVEAVRARGATVKKIITIVDRLEGAEENLKREGIELVSIFTTADLMR
jgi:orotate phosphoribosyltransferase